MYFYKIINFDGFSLNFEFDTENKICNIYKHYKISHSVYFNILIDVSEHIFHRSENEIIYFNSGFEHRDIIWNSSENHET